MDVTSCLSLLSFQCEFCNQGSSVVIDKLIRHRRRAVCPRIISVRKDPSRGNYFRQEILQPKDPIISGPGLFPMPIESMNCNDTNMDINFLTRLTWEWPYSRIGSMPGTISFKLKSHERKSGDASSWSLSCGCAAFVVSCEIGSDAHSGFVAAADKRA
jgi:hypothetical protein